MPSRISETAFEDLLTVRDWLRYGVSQFRAAGLVFGHGTSSAQDEAAYLILSALRLPIDEIGPWLDARLTRDERGRVGEVLDRRIVTRKPAAYLTGEAWIQGYRFRIDDRVIVPRSYIGELICTGGLDAIVGDGKGIKRILDLCTGSGCLAILAALAFPNAEVDASDISPDALTVAARNVADYGLGDRVHLVQSDLFKELGGRRYDLIIANPPYVSAAAVQAFPPEYRAEPVIAHLGGRDGLDAVRVILDEASKHVEPGGKLVVEIGSGRKILEAERPQLDFLWLDTAESEGEVFALDVTPPKAGATAAPKKRGKKVAG